MTDPLAERDSELRGRLPGLLAASDFNLQNLPPLLATGDAFGEGLEARVAPFGEVVPTLLGAIPEREGEGLLVWTRSEAVLPALSAAKRHEPVDSEALKEEVEAFADQILRARDRFGFVLVVSWSPPPGSRGLGMLDLDPARGMAGVLLQANLTLATSLSGEPGVALLDATRWNRLEDPVESVRMGYLAKAPVGRAVLQAAASDIRAAVRGFRGLSRKVVVVDLDDTLWGGIVGDAGWEGLRLGGHDPVGEAHLDFQRRLKALSHRGIVLAVVSKNDEEVALEAMRRHPEMAIRPEDLAGWRINWQDKAANIRSLAAELNLGLDSVVFIDDNPSERGRVQEALPEVLVPEWPADPLRYVPALEALPCFDQPTLSQEDAGRASMYAAERARREVRDTVSSMEEWLSTLEIEVEVRPLTRADLPRAAQLLNKTNQMNLSTRRLTDGELWAWTSKEGNGFWTVRVRDRFGDYGLTGLVSLSPIDGPQDEQVARVSDFVLSCRVFGRNVEEAMMAVAAREAEALGYRAVLADLEPTDRNAPTRAFFVDRSGLEQVEENRFILRDPAAYPGPPHVALRLAVASSDAADG